MYCGRIVLHVDNLKPVYLLAAQLMCGSARSVLILAG